MRNGKRPNSDRKQVGQRWLGATKGVFVTTSSFSNHAVDYGRHLPQRVILIDGERIAELLVEHGVGVRVSRTIAVKRFDEDFFADD